MSKPLILFHANCTDGWCAAWVAHLALGDDADYLPVQYGQLPPDVAGRRVYIVDFSYPRAVLIEMAKQAKWVIVLDHHKTAQEDLADAKPIHSAANKAFAWLQWGAKPSEGFAVVFDMAKSGGRLTWEHFFPGKPSPWLVDYTEDRDLWRWKLAESKAVSAALAARPKTFDEWDRLHHMGTPLDTLAHEGWAILRYQALQIDAICANARETQIDEYRVLAVNSCLHFSEVGERLAEGKPFGAVWFIRADGKKQWSLRSREGGIDVSEVARRHGGGGHKQAAGYEE